MGKYKEFGIRYWELGNTQKIQQLVTYFSLTTDYSPLIFYF